MDMPLPTNPGSLLPNPEDCPHLDECIRERTADLEFFVHAVAHDLRTPLRAIEGFSTILREQKADRLDDQGRRMLDKVRDEARHLNHLFEGLLTFSRTSSRPMTRETVDMTALAGSVIDTLHRLSPKRNVDFRLHPLPPAKGDQAMLRQVFFNLIANALKFTSERSSALIEIAGRQRDGRLEYRVHDNGVGFPQQHAPRLFEPFRRLHDPKRFDGSGLGLTIARRVIQRHGGQMWAQSIPDKGATFYFTIDASQ